MEIEGHRTDIVLAMQIISLFSGIGGFELASEWAGWDNVVSCEINPFGRRVLEYYWPNSYHHDDIHTLNRETIEKNSRWNQAESTVIVGGFPCQPYSIAGKRKGKEDERHLWPEMLRLIQEVSPKWVVGENVFGIVNWSGGLVFDEVQTDLEAAGYEVQPYVLPACSVNAPHRRDRVWFVAIQNVSNSKLQRLERKNRFRMEKSKEFAKPTASNSDSNGHELRGLGEDRQEKGESIENSEERKRIRSDNRGTSKQGAVTDTNSSIGCERWLHTERPETTARHTSTCNARSYQRTDWSNFPTQHPVCSRNDGISSRLVGITVSKHRNESIKAYGNAIVPQVVYQIFKAINEYGK